MFVKIVAERSLAKHSAQPATPRFSSIFQRRLSF